LSGTLVEGENRPYNGVGADLKAGAAVVVAPVHTKAPFDTRNVAMKKSIVLSLTDEELQDLYRVLIDRDAEGALRFLDQHMRKKVHQALEGG
jgi:hypothetical protein